MSESAASGSVRLPLHIGLETEPRALTTCINELLAAVSADVVFLLGDHIVFHERTVEEVLNRFASNPVIGAVGMRIENLPPASASPYAFMALSRRFLNRFKMRNGRWEVFCPDYYHFCADTELGEYAESIGAFHFAASATITTHSPAAGNAATDETYRAGRTNKAADMDIRRKRQAAGLLWGKSFERINPNGWE